jgi:tRNA(fMet)-specific endonuclease VapC
VSFWILDTDTLSLFQRSYPLVIKRVNAISSQHLATTIVTFEEQMYGRLNRIKRADSPEALVFAYTQLQETLEDFKSINILQFNEDVVNYYAEFKRQKLRVGTQDLRIASITIAHNAILVTRNQRDFSRIPGLRFEDWTIEN